MERLKRPSELDIDSLNFADVWNEWKEAWELYRISSGLHEKDDVIQIVTSKVFSGPKQDECSKPYQTFPEISRNGLLQVF